MKCVAGMDLIPPAHMEAQGGETTPQGAASVPGHRLSVAPLSVGALFEHNRSRFMPSMPPPQDACCLFSGLLPATTVVN